MWNLYVVPGPSPSTSPCQMPDEPCGSRGCEPGVQPLKSPMTDTRWAFGAQTPNTTPAGTSWAPSRSYRRGWAPPLDNPPAPPPTEGGGRGPPVGGGRGGG